MQLIETKLVQMRLMCGCAQRLRSHNAAQNVATGARGVDTGLEMLLLTSGDMVLVHMTSTCCVHRTGRRADAHSQLVSLARSVDVIERWQLWFKRSQTKMLRYLHRFGESDHRHLLTA